MTGNTDDGHERRGRRPAGWVQRHGIEVFLAALILLVAFGYDPVRTALDDWRVRTEVLKSWDELVEGAQAIGNGPDTVVVFSDFQCPFCRWSAETLDTIPEVTILLRHFPLSRSHPGAEALARASICAQTIGTDPQVHRVLYLLDGDVSMDTLASLLAGHRIEAADSPSLPTLSETG